MPRRCSGLLVVQFVATWAPAPRPRSTTSAFSPVVVARAILGGWRWSHESEFYGDLLLEELLAVGALDSFLGLAQRGVLDENVALGHVSPTVAPC